MVNRLENNLGMDLNGDGYIGGQGRNNKTIQFFSFNIILS
jgi:hypothetical protein